MKKLRYWLNIQLFGEGGGDGGASSSGEASAGEGIGTGDNIMPENMPDRAKKIYQKVLQKRGKVDTSQSVAEPTEATPTEEETAPTPTKKTFKELLDSDEDYKKSHDDAVKKAVKDRFKTHDAELAKYKSLVELGAKKYGIDTTSESYLSDLETALTRDEAYYEQYAIDNDVSVETARKMVTAEDKIARWEEADRERKEAEESARMMDDLRKKEAAAKVKYPNLDLDTEMQSPEFRRLLAAVNGDVETAYFVTHRNEILTDTVSKATKQAQENTVNTIRANQGRPAENGLSSQTQADSVPSWKGKGLEGIRAYAEEQRRLRGR